MTVQRLFSSLQKNKHTKIVDLLIKAKADINQICNDCRTALFVAVEMGHTEIVQLLINAGADVNQAAYRGWTPLFAAASRGHTETVRVLINAKANVNQGCDSDRLTPLRIATQYGHSKIVELLIEANADANERDSHDSTSLFIDTDNSPIAADQLSINAHTNNNQVRNDNATLLSPVTTNNPKNISEPSRKTDVESKTTQSKTITRTSNSLSSIQAGWDKAPPTKDTLQSTVTLLPARERNRRAIKHEQTEVILDAREKIDDTVPLATRDTHAPDNIQPFQPIEQSPKACCRCTIQ